MEKNNSERDERSQTKQKSGEESQLYLVIGHLKKVARAYVFAKAPLVLKALKSKSVRKNDSVLLVSSVLPVSRSPLASPKTLSRTWSTNHSLV